MIFKRINKRYYILFIITICIFLPYLSHKFIYGDDFPCHIANMISILTFIIFMSFYITRNTRINKYISKMFVKFKDRVQIFNMIKKLEIKQTI